MDYDFLTCDNCTSIAKENEELSKKIQEFEKEADKWKKESDKQARLIKLLKEVVCTKNFKIREEVLPADIGEKHAKYLKDQDSIVRAKSDFSNNSLKSILKNQHKYFKEIEDLKLINSDLEGQVKHLIFTNKQLHTALREAEDELRKNKEAMQKPKKKSTKKGLDRKKNNLITMRECEASSDKVEEHHPMEEECSQSNSLVSTVEVIVEDVLEQDIIIDELAGDSFYENSLQFLEEIVKESEPEQVGNTIESQIEKDKETLVESKNKNSPESPVEIVHENSPEPQILTIHDSSSESPSEILQDNSLTCPVEVNDKNSSDKLCKDNVVNTENVNDINVSSPVKDKPESLKNASTSANLVKAIPSFNLMSDNINKRDNASHLNNDTDISGNSQKLKTLKSQNNKNTQTNLPHSKTDDAIHLNPCKNTSPNNKMDQKSGNQIDKNNYLQKSERPSFKSLFDGKSTTFSNNKFVFKSPLISPLFGLISNQTFKLSEGSCRSNQFPVNGASRRPISSPFSSPMISNWGYRGTPPNNLSPSILPSKGITKNKDVDCLSDSLTRLRIKPLDEKRHSEHWVKFGCRKPTFCNFLRNDDVITPRNDDLKVGDRDFNCSLFHEVDPFLSYRDRKGKFQKVQHADYKNISPKKEAHCSIIFECKVEHSETLKEEVKITLDDPYCAIKKLKESCEKLTSFEDLRANLVKICKEIDTAPCYKINRSLFGIKSDHFDKDTQTDLSKNSKSDDSSSCKVCENKSTALFSHSSCQTDNFSDLLNPKSMNALAKSKFSSIFDVEESNSRDKSNSSRSLVNKCYQTESSQTSFKSNETIEAADPKIEKNANEIDSVKSSSRHRSEQPCKLVKSTNTSSSILEDVNSNEKFPSPMDSTKNVKKFNLAKPHSDSVPVESTPMKSTEENSDCPKRRPISKFNKINFVKGPTIFGSEQSNYNNDKSSDINLNDTNANSQPDIRELKSIHPIRSSKFEHRPSLHIVSTNSSEHDSSCSVKSDLQKSSLSYSCRTDSQQSNQRFLKNTSALTDSNSNNKCAKLQSESDTNLAENISEQKLNILESKSKYSEEETKKNNLNCPKIGSEQANNNISPKKSFKETTLKESSESESSFSENECFVANQEITYKQNHKPLDQSVDLSCNNILIEKDLDKNNCVRSSETNNCELQPYTSIELSPKNLQTGSSKVGDVESREISCVQKNKLSENILNHSPTNNKNLKPLNGYLNKQDISIENPPTKQTEKSNRKCPTPRGKDSENSLIVCRKSERLRKKNIQLKSSVKTIKRSNKKTVNKETASCLTPNSDDNCKSAQQVYGKRTRQNLKNCSSFDDSSSLSSQNSESDWSVTPKKKAKACKRQVSKHDSKLDSVSSPEKTHPKCKKNISKLGSLKNTCLVTESHDVTKLEHSVIVSNSPVDETHQKVDNLAVTENKQISFEDRKIKMNKLKNDVLNLNSAIAHLEDSPHKKCMTIVSNSDNYVSTDKRQPVESKNVSLFKSQAIPKCNLSDSDSSPEKPQAKRKFKKNSSTSQMLNCSTKNICSAKKSKLNNFDQKVKGSHIEIQLHEKPEILNSEFDSINCQYREKSKKNVSNCDSISFSKSKMKIPLHNSVYSPEIPKVLYQALKGDDSGFKSDSSLEISQPVQNGKKSVSKPQKIIPTNNLIDKVLEDELSESDSGLITGSNLTDKLTLDERSESNDSGLNVDSSPDRIPTVKKFEKINWKPDSSSTARNNDLSFDGVFEFQSDKMDIVTHTGICKSNAKPAVMKNINNGSERNLNRCKTISNLDNENTGNSGKMKTLFGEDYSNEDSENFKNPLKVGQTFSKLSKVFSGNNSRPKKIKTLLPVRRKETDQKVKEENISSPSPSCSNKKDNLIQCLPEEQKYNFEKVLSELRLEALLYQALTPIGSPATKIEESPLSNNPPVKRESLEVASSNEPDANDLNCSELLLECSGELENVIQEEIINADNLVDEEMKSSNELVMNKSQILKYKGCEIEPIVDKNLEQNDMNMESDDSLTIDENEVDASEGKLNYLEDRKYEVLKGSSPKVLTTEIDLGMESQESSLTIDDEETDTNFTKSSPRHKKTIEKPNKVDILLSKFVPSENRTINQNNSKSTHNFANKINFPTCPYVPLTLNNSQKIESGTEVGSGGCDIKNEQVDIGKEKLEDCKHHGKIRIENHNGYGNSIKPVVSGFYLDSTDTNTKSETQPEKAIYLNQSQTNPVVAGFYLNNDSLNRESEMDENLEKSEINPAFGYYLNDSNLSKETEIQPKIENKQKINLRKRKLNPKESLDCIKKEKEPRMCLLDESIPCEGNALHKTLMYYCDEVKNEPKKPKKKQHVFLPKALKSAQEALNVYVSNKENFGNLETTLPCLSPPNQQIAVIILDELYKDLETDSAPRQSNKANPQMTFTQAKLLTLVISLAKQDETFYETILFKIEQEAGSLKSNEFLPLKHAVKLANFHVFICKYIGDLHRSRSFMFDTLYARGLMAHLMILKMILSWPALLPNAHVSENDLLTTTIVQLIGTVHAHYNISQALAKTYGIPTLRKIIYTRGYRKDPVAYEQLFISLVNNISKKGSELGLLLICKCLGFKWASKMIETEIFPLLEKPLEEDCNVQMLGEIIAVTGKIARGFPQIEATNFMIKTFEIYQNLLHNEERPEIVEAVVEGLTSMKIHNLSYVAKILAKWKPKSKILTRGTVNQIKLILCVKNVKYWNDFIDMYSSKT